MSDIFQECVKHVGCIAKHIDALANNIHAISHIEEYVNFLKQDKIDTETEFWEAVLNHIKYRRLNGEAH